MEQLTNEALACADLTQRVAHLEREVAWLNEWTMSIEVSLNSLLSSVDIAVKPILLLFTGF